MLRFASLFLRGDDVCDLLRVCQCLGDVNYRHAGTANSDRLSPIKPNGATIVTASGR